MKNIFILLSTLLLFSCQKVIDIHPPTGETKVIIQGYLYTDSTARVVISKSTDYLNNTPPPSLGTGVVTLSDNHGNTEILTWNAIKQQYESVTIKGVENDTYTLKVDFEGETYTSVSILPHLEPADSIKVLKETGGFEDGYFMKLYATVSTNVDLYYLFKGYADGKFLNGPNDIYYADNKWLNGNLDGIDIGYQYEVGEVAKLELFSLTHEAFEFYDAASLQLNNDGGFFSTPPANVPSMFDNGAIGLFQCSDKQIMTTTVVEQ